MAFRQGKRGRAVGLFGPRVGSLRGRGALAGRTLWPLQAAASFPHCLRPSSNSWKALATEDWLEMVSMRIQRPRMRNGLTALKDCESPDASITASVLPCVGRKTAEVRPPASGR